MRWALGSTWRWSALAVVALLVACQQDEGCTAVGCSSGLAFELDSLLNGAAGEVSVHACLDDQCVDQAEPGLSVVNITAQESGVRQAKASIKVTIDGKVVTDASIPVTLREGAPNGEKCGPICYFAGVQVTPTGLSQITSS